MSLWHMAMLCVLPLLLFSGIGSGSWRAYWHGIEPKLRCWSVIMAASAATYSIDPVRGAVPFFTYICIDFVAGVACAARPFLLFQRLIVLLFAMMVVTSGIAAGAGSDGAGLYQSTMLILGIAMWAILLWWSGQDAGRGLVALGFWGDRSRDPVPAGLAKARPIGEEP